MRFLFVLGLFFSSAAVAEESCNDKTKIYKVCSDQGQIYKAKFDQAKAEGKILIVVAGADWCPWCRSLHDILVDKKFGGAFAKRFVLADIGLYKEKEKLPSGESVLQKLKDQAHFTNKLEGIPILALVNPKGDKTTFIDTAPLEKNTKTKKGHDPQKVLAALEKSAGYIK